MADSKDSNVVEPLGGGYVGPHVQYTSAWPRYQIAKGKRPRPPSPPAKVTYPHGPGTYP